VKRDLASLRRCRHPAARRHRPAGASRVSADFQRDGVRFRDVTTTSCVLGRSDHVPGPDERDSRGYWSAISNRLNQVMKVLTVMSTIFSAADGADRDVGMNVPIPHFPGANRRVLVDWRDHAGHQRRDGLQGSAARAGYRSRWARFISCRRSCQPDCRRRGGRASGVGHQGADRESIDAGHGASPSPWSSAARSSFASRTTGTAWIRTTRGLRSSGTRRARSGGPAISADRDARVSREALRASRRYRISR